MFQRARPGTENVRTMAGATITVGAGLCVWHRAIQAGGSGVTAGLAGPGHG
jgi:hypothetical protein